MSEVYITNREIYDGLLAVQRSVEHLAGAMTERSHTLVDHESRLRVVEVNQANPKTIDDVERRLRFLERATWGIPVSAVLAVAGLAIKVGA